MKSRKSPRRSEYDYRSEWWYFVTICCKDRQHYFGEIGRDDLLGRPIMQLNDLWKYCYDYIQQLQSWRSSVEIHEFVVMPNHVHLLILMKEFDSSNNQPIIDHRQNRRDDLLGRPNNENINVLENINDDDNNLLGYSINENHIDIWSDHKGHAKSVSLQPIINSDYVWPTLWSIINMFKGAITKYAKSWILIQFDDVFARQPRYHDRIIRNQLEYDRIKHYIQTNVEHRQTDTFNQ